MGLLITAAIICWAIIGFGVAALLDVAGLWEFSLVKGLGLTFLLAAYRLWLLARRR